MLFTSAHPPRDQPNPTQFFPYSNTVLNSSVTFFLLSNNMMKDLSTLIGIVFLHWRKRILVQEKENTCSGKWWQHEWWQSSLKTYLCNISCQTCALLWSSGRDNEICNWQWWKIPQFLVFMKKTRRRSWIYLHLSQIQLKKEFSKVSERHKDEFTVVAVIINAWVSEVEMWNLLIYINLSPRQT